MSMQRAQRMAMPGARMHMHCRQICTNSRFGNGYATAHSTHSLRHVRFQGLIITRHACVEAALQ